MSKLRNTSKDIKKKLSFKDYHAGDEEEVYTDKDQQASVTARQYDGKPAQQNNDMTFQWETNTAKRYKDAKVKATYYLGKEEHEMLKQLYIDMLKRESKADRSALICQAIRVLYSQYYSE